MADDVVLHWITGHAHHCYLICVGLFGGGQWAEAIVGNAALAVVTVFAVLSGRYVVREAAGMVWALLKIIAALLLAVFFAIWAVRVYVFVYGRQPPSIPMPNAWTTMPSDNDNAGAGGLVAMAWRWLGLADERSFV